MLLLDEPFGALDAKVRKELRQWLRRLHDELHITSIFVTHDQDEALEVADRIVLMNKGRVEQTGTTQEVYETPGDGLRLQLPRRRQPASRPRRRRHSARRRRRGAARRALRRCSGGEDVVAFARPHELDIVVDGDAAARACPPRCSRVLLSGAIARVELTGTIGSNGHAEPQHFEVELTREQLARAQPAARSGGALDLVAAQGVPAGAPELSRRCAAPSRRCSRLRRRLPALASAITAALTTFSGSAGEHSSMKR